MQRATEPATTQCQTALAESPISLRALGPAHRNDANGTYHVPIPNAEKLPDAYTCSTYAATGRLTRTCAISSSTSA